MTAALALSGVNKHYGDFTLQDITLDLPEGQIMGLVGANGAGKSTIMRLLMGLIRPDAGTVELCGHRMPDAQVAAKRDVGYASEDMRLYKTKTLRWHMDFIQGVYGAWEDAYATHLLQRFDLKAHQAVGGFSHGQRVKALLLLVLARRPRVLLLDEPTTGLDPVARTEVLEALADVLRDESRSVLFSSHNTTDVEQLSDTITFLHKGALVASQDKETFLSSWKRILCQGPWEPGFSALPEVVSARNNGSLIELKVRDADEAFLARLAHMNLAVKAVEPMSLEDIFVTSVRAGEQA